ncbi:MAG: hypothetical protein BroJett001_27950 [Chloroflexota bacterium]|nr:MAG: hypothetical protein BroJett001_27950 [Chloroflexota bacterium]
MKKEINQITYRPLCFNCGRESNKIGSCAGDRPTAKQCKRGIVAIDRRGTGKRGGRSIY